MIFTETKLHKSYILEIKKIEDDRGFFGRSWCRNELEEKGLNSNIAQANTSFSFKKGTLRGMHFQVHPNEETKLIRCVRGAIFDVIIDLRPDSPTFKEWIGVELTADNYKMLYVPEGFAHGFVTLTDNVEVYYNVTAFYTPGAERGIRWNDPQFEIDWPISPVVISDKDQAHPDFTIEMIK
jgi:dTDP-4-dehydrorhamnose 3,5-epimerase